MIRIKSEIKENKLLVVFLILIFIILLITSKPIEKNVAKEIEESHVNT